MFCKSCGNKLDDKAKFCPQCGEKIEVSPNCGEKAEQEEIKVTVSFAKEPESTNKIAHLGRKFSIFGIFFWFLLPPAIICSTIGFIQGIIQKGENLGHAITGLNISISHTIFLLSLFIR